MIAMLVSAANANQLGCGRTAARPRRVNLGRSATMDRIEHLCCATWPRCCEGLAASTSLVQSALPRLLFRLVQAEPVRVVQVPLLESMLRLPIFQEGELR